MKVIKSLFAALLLCGLGTMTYAQAGSVTVINSTNCTVYYVLMGVPAPGCGTGFSGSLISLAPGGVITYPTSSAIPGYPPGPVYWIGGAKIVSGPTTCSPISTWPVGEPCSGFPPITPAFSYLPSCVVCAQYQVRWFPASAPGGTARMQFF